MKLTGLAGGNFKGAYRPYAMDNHKNRSKIHLTTPFTVRRRQVAAEVAAGDQHEPAGPHVTGDRGRAPRGSGDRWRRRKKIERLWLSARILRRRRDPRERKATGRPQIPPPAPVESIPDRRRLQLAALLAELKSCRWWQTARQAWLIEKMEAVVKG
jgi:hypothetical protein